MEGAGAEDDGFVGAREGAGEEGEFVIPEEGGEVLERGIGFWEEGPGVTSQVRSSRVRESAMI